MLLLISVILAVSFIVFTLMDLAPGDPVDLIAAGGDMTQEDIAALRADLGLDRPLIVRYGRYIYMFRLIQGDLGVSDLTRISGWDTYISRLPYTLALSAGALVIGAGVSIPLGIHAAKKSGEDNR